MLKSLIYFFKFSWFYHFTSNRHQDHFILLYDVINTFLLIKAIYAWCAVELYIYILPYRRLPSMRTLLCITSIVMLFLRRVVKWLLKTLSSLYCFLISIIYSPYTVPNFSRNTYMKISNNVCFLFYNIQEIVDTGSSIWLHMTLCILTYSR